MKKIRLIAMAVVILTLLVVGAAAPALSHSGDSDATSYTGAYIDGPTMVRLAEALGLTADELSSHLKSGENLADIAREQSVPTEALINAIVTPYAEQLQLQVRYGYLTQEQADALLETAREHANSLLEQNLSSTGGNVDRWQEMEDYCGNMIGNHGGSAGYGDMMGSSGVMMGPGMMGGHYGSGYGSGGMMGTGAGYNDSMPAWSAPTPNNNRVTDNGWTSVFGRFWNGLSGQGSRTMGGGMGGGMMGGW